jgi:hypothetical protein
MDLRKIKTVFICPDHNEKYKARCAYMFDLLKSLGFERVAHYKSAGYTSDVLYPLNIATYNILQMHMDEPVLILEDDLEFVKSASFIIDPPKDAEAVYVGISGCNMNFEKNINEGHALVIPIDAQYMKIQNMLSAHAILYLTPSYKKCIAYALSLTRDPNDMELCKHQASYAVYGLRRPICWQSAKFNVPWIEYVTKIQINDDGYAEKLLE